MSSNANLITMLDELNLPVAAERVNSAHSATLARTFSHSVTGF